MKAFSRSFANDTLGDTSSAKATRRKHDQRNVTVSRRSTL